MDILIELELINEIPEDESFSKLKPLLPTEEITISAEPVI